MKGHIKETLMDSTFAWIFSDALQKPARLNSPVEAFITILTDIFTIFCGMQCKRVNVVSEGFGLSCILKLRFNETTLMHFVAK